MNIFICANLNKEKTEAIFPEVVRTIKSCNMTPMVEDKYESVCSALSLNGILYGDAEKNAEKCDVFLTIGGDGTILRWGKRAALHNKPLLGINTGRLGFMATLEKDNLSRLAVLSRGEYKLSPRMMLDVTVDVNGEEKKYTALNDVILFKGTTSKLPEYLVFNGEAEVTRVRADGLIISTPTGSTAYSLSAGGPIIDPKLECFELTALSPHTLFNRPMIFSVDEPLKAEFIAYENSKVFVSVDGGGSIEIFPNDTVLISKSKNYLNLIDIDGISFYNSVHNKLMQPLK
ncbi:MAG: NAD(+)/NADH kinase [Firmicutes bacterium]|nr:NAD(+)/NADH kinase [[Eubacterium] siraeum]MCM1487379.1 NAD(+)/NADH kinase [Bacillota bacterium]